MWEGWGAERFVNECLESAVSLLTCVPVFVRECAITLFAAMKNRVRHYSFRGNVELTVISNVLDFSTWRDCGPFRPEEIVRSALSVLSLLGNNGRCRPLSDG